MPNPLGCAKMSHGTTDDSGNIKMKPTIAWISLFVMLATAQGAAAQSSQKDMRQNKPLVGSAATPVPAKVVEEPPRRISPSALRYGAKQPQVPHAPMSEEERRAYEARLKQWEDRLAQLESQKLEERARALQAKRAVVAGRLASPIQRPEDKQELLTEVAARDKDIVKFGPHIQALRQARAVVYQMQNRLRLDRENRIRAMAAGHPVLE